MIDMDWKEIEVKSHLEDEGEIGESFADLIICLDENSHQLEM